MCFDLGVFVLLLAKPNGDSLLPYYLSGFAAMGGSERRRGPTHVAMRRWAALVSSNMSTSNKPLKFEQVYNARRLADQLPDAPGAAINGHAQHAAIPVLPAKHEAQKFESHVRFKVPFRPSVESQ